MTALPLRVCQPGLSLAPGRPALAEIRARGAADRELGRVVVA
ncbi:MAG TPA: hypothetical protein VK659_09270 [Asanoa sp.]|nr:hypothetical protein [Asanoa sp.]